MSDDDMIRRGTAKNPWTQADIDAVQPDKLGVRDMPPGFYAPRCSFGARCSFENGLNPDDWRRPYFAVDRIGSENRKAYFFRTGGVMHVRAGCFWGDETAFLAKLAGDRDPRKERQYLAALELARDILGDE